MADFKTNNTPKTSATATNKKVVDAGTDKIAYSSARKSDQAFSQEHSFKTKGSTFKDVAVDKVKSGAKKTAARVPNKVLQSTKRGLKASLESNQITPTDKQILDGNDGKMARDEASYQVKKKAHQKIKQKMAGDQVQHRLKKESATNKGFQTKRYSESPAEAAAKKVSRLQKERAAKKALKEAEKDAKKLTKKELGTKKLSRSEKIAKKVKENQIKRNAKKKAGKEVFKTAGKKAGQEAGKKGLLSIFAKGGAAAAEGAGGGAVAAAIGVVALPVLAAVLLLLVVTFVPLMFGLGGGAAGGAATAAMSTYNSDDAQIYLVEGTYQKNETDLQQTILDKSVEGRTQTEKLGSSKDDPISEELYNYLSGDHRQDGKYLKMDYYGVYDIGHNPYTLQSYLHAKYQQFSYTDVFDDISELFAMQYGSIDENYEEIITEVPYTCYYEVITQTTTENNEIEESKTVEQGTCIAYNYEINYNHYSIDTAVASLLDDKTQGLFDLLQETYGNKEYLFGSDYTTPVYMDKNGNYLSTSGNIINIPSGGYSGNVGAIGAGNWQDIYDFTMTYNTNVSGWDNPNQCTTFAGYKFNQLYGLTPPAVAGNLYAAKIVEMYPDKFELSTTPAPGAIYSCGYNSHGNHVGIITGYDATAGTITFSDGNTSNTALGPITNAQHNDVTIDYKLFYSVNVNNHGSLIYAIPKQ